VQLGITATSLTMGWLGEPALARLFRELDRKRATCGDLRHAVAVAVAFVIITSLLVIMGELVPKSSRTTGRAGRAGSRGAHGRFPDVTRPLTMALSASAVLSCAPSERARFAAVRFILRTNSS